MIVERRKDRRPIKKVALVTAVPAALKALTGLDAATLPERSLYKTRLKARDFACLSASNTVDLIYVPVVEGSYTTTSHEAASALKAAAAGYDMVVDLCEFTALYRRGKTPDAEIADFQAKHGDVPLGVLEYQNFLKVIDVLQTIFVTLRGRVVRPRDIAFITNEWTRRKARPNLADFSVLDEFYVDKDPFWCDLVGKSQGMLVDAADEGKQEALAKALKQLDPEMNTLGTRAMISDFVSNLSQMIGDIVTSTDPTFTHDADGVFATRRAKYQIEAARASSEAARTLVEGCEELEKEIKDVLESEKLTQHLVDQYQFFNDSLSEVDAPLQLTEAQDRTRAAFREQFTYLSAFIDLWDRTEQNNSTVAMNRKVNGWYMSNSSLNFIVDAMRVGLNAEVTSWAVVAMATNSVGFLPDVEEYIASIKTAVEAELNVLFGQMAEV